MRRLGSLLAVGLGLLIVFVPASFAGEVKISLQLSPEAAKTELYSAVLTMSAEAADDQPAVSFEKALTVPGEVTFSLPVGRSWRLALQSQELWLPEAVVLGSAATESLSFYVWPLGTLEGQVVLAPEEKTEPELLDAFVTSVPQTSAARVFARSAFRCPIQDHRVLCRLPAGIVDLKLKAKGFMPHYFWDLTIPSGKSFDFGKVALRRGSAVSGRVEVDGRPKEGTRTTIELVPLETAQRPIDEQPGDVHRQAFRREAQEPNARGFFLFAGVPPGAYELLARHEGFADVSSGPVNVVNDVEMELAEPLVLAPPLHIEASIDPPVDPWGDPWVIGLSLYGNGALPRLIGKSAAELSGSWRRQDLAPGEYLIEIGKDELGGFYSERIDLTRGSASLQVKIPLLKVHGRARLGSEPLEADLHFNNGRASLRLASNPEGEYEGLLTEPGDWKVIVVARKLQLIKRLPRVEVQPAPGSEEAEVPIELADNRLRGRIVDEQGKGMRSTVYAIGTGSDGLRSVGTDLEGEFEFRGLEPEQFLISAETPDDQTSEQILIQITEKIEPAFLEIVVRQKITLAGRLVFDGLGAPEAEVSAVPLQAPLSASAVAATDVEGRFELKLPKGTSHAVLTLKARGFALRTLTVPVEPGKLLEIPLSQVSGGVALEFERQPDLDYRSGISSCLLHNGTCFGIQILSQWARANGGKGWVEPLKFSVPNLEPGDYAFCVIKNTDLVAMLLGAPPPGRCVSGAVVPGGELSLKAPAPPKLE